MYITFDIQVGANKHEFSQPDELSRAIKFEIRFKQIEAFEFYFNNWQSLPPERSKFDEIITKPR